MKKNYFKKVCDFFKKVARAAPGGVPVAGNVYSNIINEMNNDQLISILENIRELSKKETEIVIEKICNSDKNIINKIEDLIRTKISKANEVKKITVIIPCGGKAGSMYPFSSGMPKSLFIINTKPMIQTIIDKFDKKLISQVLITVDRFENAIEESVKKYKKFVKCKRINKPVPGSLLSLKKDIKDYFLLHNDDILIENIDWFDVLKEYKSLKEKENIIGMLLCSKYYPMPIGLIEEKEPNIVQKYTEKPEYLIDRYANLGVSIFEPQFLEYIDEKDSTIYDESMDRAIKEGKFKISLYKVKKWYHIHDLNDYYNIQKTYYPNDM